MNDVVIPYSAIFNIAKWLFFVFCVQITTQKRSWDELRGWNESYLLIIWKVQSINAGTILGHSLRPLWDLKKHACSRYNSLYTYPGSRPDELPIWFQTLINIGSAMVQWSTWCNILFHHALNMRKGNLRFASFFLTGSRILRQWHITRVARLI